MSTTREAARADASYQPLLASHHRGILAPSRLTASGMLVTYVVLLFAVPSNVAVLGMGSLGRPALLWGLLLLVWWGLMRLQMQVQELRTPRQPVRWAIGVMAVIVLISFAAAMLRGQPADQVSPAITGLLRMASWSGVVLVAIDGLRTQNDVARVVRALLIAAGCVSVLGIAQFLTGSSLLEWVGSIPGFAYDWGGIDSRGEFIRAAGTGTHPLEFVAAVVSVLPLAIAAAITGGFTHGRARRWIWVAIVAVILIVCLVAVSRSAIIGLVVAFAAFLPWLPKTYRLFALCGGGIAMAAVVAVVPGMWSTTISLFANASEDSSTQSRTDALERVPEFLSTSPVIGHGWGTFMSRYYIFDNQWVGILLELGVAGVIGIVCLIGSAIGSALFAVYASRYPEIRLLAGAVIAGLVTLGVLFAFFDGLGFPISAGVFFLLLGIAAALRTVAASDRVLHRGGALSAKR